MPRGSLENQAYTYIRTLTTKYKQPNNIYYSTTTTFNKQESTMNTKNFNTKTMNVNEYATFDEVAKIMGVRYQQVYHRAERGALGTIYELFGKKVIKRSEVENWKKTRAEYFSKMEKKTTTK